MSQSGGEGRAEEVPTFVVVLPQQRRYHLWNRVPLINEIPERILVQAGRWRTMRRRERLPRHVQRVLLPKCGALWQARNDVEVGLPVSGEDVARLIKEAIDELLQQPQEVASAVLDWFSVRMDNKLFKVIRAPLAHYQRVLMRLDDSIGDQEVAERLKRFTGTWATYLVEAAFGSRLGKEELAHIADAIAEGARVGFGKQVVQAMDELENLAADALRRRLRGLLCDAVTAQFETLWKHKTKFDDCCAGLQHPHQGFERYENLLEAIVIDAESSGATLAERCEAAGIPVKDMYDYQRRRKYRGRR